MFWIHILWLFFRHFALVSFECALNFINHIITHESEKSCNMSLLLSWHGQPNHAQFYTVDTANFQKNITILQWLGIIQQNPADTRHEQSEWVQCCTWYVTDSNQTYTVNYINNIKMINKHNNLQTFDWNSPQFTGQKHKHSKN